LFSTAYNIIDQLMAVLCWTNTLKHSSQRGPL